MKCFSGFAACWLLFGIAPVFSESGKPNILFIAVDDLRPELGAYGAGHIRSPHIDRLAEQGLTFTRAYTSVPTCGASRASLFTGVRPAPSRFLTHLAIAEQEAPWAVTMNTQFKSNGYKTVSLGKVFHNPTDNSKGWSEKPWRPAAPRYALPENAKAAAQGPSTEEADVPDESYQDGEIAGKAVVRLQELAKQPDQPFFLAVGFMKPHLPFCAPKHYWDLYPKEDIHLPKNYFLPKNVPEAAAYDWGELRSYSDIPAKGPITDAQARHLIRGYYACVSYVDAQVGKVLDELERLDLAKNTIVVLWGDHGWNLGDHTYWCKHTLFESSLHIPLIVRVPGLAARKQTAVLTESVDIYPTLCELAGIPAPDTLEGTSFTGLLKDPAAELADLAYSRFGRGDSIRTERFRYSEYRGKDGQLIGRMLYDHEKDSLENHNVVDDPEQTERVGEFATMLKKAKAATRKN